jgi:hypothetical protein
VAEQARLSRRIAANLSDASSARRLRANAIVMQSEETDKFRPGSQVRA